MMTMDINSNVHDINYRNNGKFPVLTCLTATINRGATFTRGAIIFFRIGGFMKKLGVTDFFHENRGVTKKNQETDGWLQILMKILFNEIAPKMHIFHATRIVGYMFLQHCSSRGGQNI